MKLYQTILLLIITFTVSQLTFAQSPFDTTIYGKNPAAGKYIKTRGFKMYYETYGKGEPLLIIHGNGGSVFYKDQFNQTVGDFFKKPYRKIEKFGRFE